MRKIKFRGKRLHDGKWVYGSPLIVDTEKRKVAMIVTLHEAYPDTLAKVTTSVDIETVGQFTGLTDKNGKEIYEGDIVRSTICAEFVYEVAYNDERFASFGLRRKQDAFMHYFGEAIEAEECEVIGNVFDNPELLKGEQYGN